MGIVNRIVKNTGILFLFNILSKFFGFLYVMYMARYLGTEGFGIISFSLAFTGMFNIFLDMGTYSLMIREVARNTSLTEKYVGNSISIKFVLSLLTLILMSACIFLMGYPIETIYIVYIFFIYSIFSAYNNIFYSVYQAHEKMTYFGLGSSMGSFLILLGTILGIYSNKSLYYFAYVFLCSNIVVFIYNLLVTNLKFTKIKLDADFSFWRDFLKEAWPFALSGVFVTIYFWIDSVMISYFIDETSVGLYNAAYRLVYVLLFIPAVYFSTIYPILSRLYKNSDIVKTIYGRSLKYFAILGMLMGTIITLSSEKIIYLVYGSEFLESAGSLKILIWATSFSFLAHSTLYTLNSINKQIIYTKITAISMFLNVILNILIIPKYGYIGASLTTLLTEFLGFFIMFLYLKNHFNEKFYEYIWFLRLTVVTIISTGIYGVLMSKIGIFEVSIVVFTMAYMLGIITLVFDNKDIELLNELSGVKK
jgi:O-antigen/teichoic acid export membrane protein